MGISTSTGTLTAGQSRTFNLAPASAVTLTLLPNARVTITESPATVTATGLGGNATRVHEPRLPGTFTYGPYLMGGTVVVVVASNSGSSVAWMETRAAFDTASTSGVTTIGPGDGVGFGVKGAGSVWYVDPRIAPGDESDSFDGGAGVGKLRDSWADVTWAANDVFLQACGSTYTGAVTVGGSGTDGAPITIGMYGVGQLPIIDANGASTGCIYATGRNYIDISDFQLIGATGFPAAGVHMLTTSNVTIRRVWSHGNEYGIRLDNAGSSAVSNLTVQGCLVEDSDQIGIVVICGTSAGGYIDGVTITGNTVRNSGTVVDNNGITVYTRLASTAAYDATRSVRNCTVDNNIIDGATGYGLFCRYVVGGSFSGNEVTGVGSALDADTHGIWVGGCKNITVELNHIHDNFAWVGGSIGSGVGIYVDQGATTGTSGHDSARIIVRNNHIHDQAQVEHSGTHSGAAIYVYRSNDASIYGNLIERCKNGIACRGATTMNTARIDIHNNTLIDITEIALPVGNLADTITRQNNIVLRAAVGLWTESGANAAVDSAHSYNDAFGCARPFASGTLAALTDAAAGTGDVTTDPNIAPDGRPQATTPTGISLDPERDPTGRWRTRPPTMGAYQYAATTSL